MPEAILTVDGLCKNFGGLQAVVDLSFDVHRGSVTGLIGPNGAGKSTASSLIAGELRPDRGRILFNGRNIAGLTPHSVARLGIARTFQLARELGHLSVLENLLFAPYPQRGDSMWHAVVQGRAVREEEERLRERAYKLMEMFALTQLRNDVAQSLSGGQKKLLELARSLMTQPTLLLMDEPTAGVNPVLIDHFIGHIRTLKAMGITVLIVEHNLRVMEDVCDDVIVMAQGTNMARGTMDELRANPAVIEAYLGEGRAVHGAV